MFPGPANDSTRQKYSTNNLTEYQVSRTEGGEWLNYTRVFSNQTYNVYLRAAGRSRQMIHLEKVNSDPAQTNQTTTRWGSFTLPNMGMTINYRFVPLLDTNGIPVKIDLNETNTVRLLLDGPVQPATQYTAALSYLLFVPATIAPSLQLESSLVVKGGYGTDTAATIDAALEAYREERSNAPRLDRNALQDLSEEERTAEEGAAQ